MVGIGIIEPCLARQSALSLPSCPACAFIQWRVYICCFFDYIIWAWTPTPSNFERQRWCKKNESLSSKLDQNWKILSILFKSYTFSKISLNQVGHLQFDSNLKFNFIVYFIPTQCFSPKMDLFCNEIFFALNDLLDFQHSGQEWGTSLVT